MVSAELASAYRKQRDWQKSCWAGGGSLTVYPSGRTEVSFASAPYGFHAVSAYIAARQSMAARKRRAADLAALKRRSKASKKGWKSRRAQAAA